VHVEPVSILSVRDATGKLLQEAQPQAREVLKPAVAYVVTSMLQDVLDRGTAAGLRSSGAFTRIAAGKTGSTSDFSDAWFVGYTPELVAGCWFGYDQRRRIGQLLTGGTLAAPVWADFMNGALQGQPERAFPVPQGVQFSSICADTGRAPTPGCRRSIEEAFVEGSAVQTDEVPDSAQSMEEFWNSELEGGAAPASPAAQALSPAAQALSPTAQGLSPAAAPAMQTEPTPDGLGGF
jgi:penicillin-binding protein 1A